MDTRTAFDVKTDIDVYNLFKDKFGGKAAQSLLEYLKSAIQKDSKAIVKEELVSFREKFNGEIENKIAHESKSLATKADVTKVEKDLSDTKSELKDEIAKVEKNLSDTKSELKDAIADTKSELKADITQVEKNLSDTKSELKDAIADTKSELKADITQVEKNLAQVEKSIADARIELKNEIANTKSELLRTVYIVGVVQFLAIVVSVLAIIKFVL